MSSFPRISKSIITSPTISRRQALGYMGALSIGTLYNQSHASALGQKKFIFILLRGAMDGLSALIPKDGSLRRLRRGLLSPLKESHDLKNGFLLHPAFTHLKAMYDAGDVTFIHAAATQYRQRSHFDGQDYLEILGPENSQDGWLNRALLTSGGQGLAIARAIPMSLLGPAPVTNWSPSLFNSVSPDLLNRLTELYSADPQLAASLKDARSTQLDISASRGDNRKFTQHYPIALEALGRLMKAQGGPNIGMVGLEGWDTHANQANALDRKFTILDEGLNTLKQELGGHWKNTAIVVCSEFGRTVSVNGTRGTDHGTGGLMMLLGGAIKGGNIKGEWPGIETKNLYKGRDLAPANDVTAVLKGVLRDHMGLDRQRLDTLIFPQSSRAFDDLIQS